MGGSVRLRGGSAESARVAAGGRGCDAWYAVEPRGYVCAGVTATLDPSDPAVVALRRDGPDLTSPWPYRYGEAIHPIGAPRYDAIPTPAEQRSTEWELPAHLEAVERARGLPDDQRLAVAKHLVGVDLEPAGVPAPVLFRVSPAIREARRMVYPGSTLAWTRAFDVAGRTFLLTSDHAIVPKDRVRPYPRSSFQGVRLGGGVELPIAYFRKMARPKYRKALDGSFEPTGATWAARSWVALTGTEERSGARTFLATREDGLYADAADATVLRPSTPPPFSDRGDAGTKTWIEVSVLGGWLIAYEGTTPVFATLISPGRGGIPYPGRDPISTASTPVGTFRVDGKFRIATMVSSTDPNIVHADVQYVQNFHGPHALHGAYWHDAWGEPKSGGCINLSPIDAKYLFEWTDPQVPEGWHGLRSAPELGYATIVVVHR